MNAFIVVNSAEEITIFWVLMLFYCNKNYYCSMLPANSWEGVLLLSQITVA